MIKDGKIYMNVIFFIFKMVEEVVREIVEFCIYSMNMYYKFILGYVDRCN